MTVLRRSQRLRSRFDALEHCHTLEHFDSLQCHMKRSHNGSSRDAEQQTWKRRRLTEKNLRTHTRDLEEKGGKRKSETSRSRSYSSTTPTDRQFGTKLIEKGVVFLEYNTIPPTDKDELLKSLLEKQDSATPTATSWDKLKSFTSYADGGDLSLECLIVESALTHHDSVTPPLYARFRNEQWTEINNELTAGVTNAKPNVMETFYLQAYPPRTRDDFPELVISQYGYAMPTFAMESTGPAGDPSQVVRQAAYDGALMTHAAIAIDGYLKEGQEGSLYRKTKAITITISPEFVRVFANHAVKIEDPEAEKLENEKSEDDKTNSKIVYHQSPLYEVRYIASEANWQEAHLVLYNAQRLGFELAQSRLKDLQNYYKKKHLHDMKKWAAQNTNLQEKARAETVQAMGIPPPKRLRKADEVQKPASLISSSSSSSSLKRAPEADVKQATPLKRYDQQMPSEATMPDPATQQVLVSEGQ